MEDTTTPASARKAGSKTGKVIVTCGPSFEPIDEVRRITNSSTGEVGVMLARELVREGWEVLCCKGSGSTCPGPEPPARLIPFETNDDLLRLLEANARAGNVGVVFHAAALCDYKVAGVRDGSGGTIRSAKIASRAGALHLMLEPATKVLVSLRDLFPASLLVGWKFELAGTRAEALDKARRQMQECRTDACVINGRAFGRGFGFCRRSGELVELENKTVLVRFLAGWLAGH